LLAGNIKTICKKDLRKVDGKSRNEELARALLMSLSRNIGTNVADTTIIEDIKLFDNSMSKPTFDSYYNALKNIHVIEELPA
jgi:predicted AAA+ superfamily ATPase